MRVYNFGALNWSSRAITFLAGTLLVLSMLIVQPNPAQAVETGPVCDPSTFAHDRGTRVGDACIAGAKVRSRGRFKDHAPNGLPCLLGSVRVPSPQNPTSVDNYPTTNACGGGGRGQNGIEAIAHTRFINRANTDPDVRSALGLGWTDTAGPGEVDLGIQWEPQFNDVEGSNEAARNRDGRPDAVVFDPSATSSGMIRVAEVKTAVSGDIRDVYKRQLVPYVDWLSDHGSRPAGLLDVTGYHDSFAVCGVRYDVAADAGLSDGFNSVANPTGVNALLVATQVAPTTTPVQQQVTDDEEASTCPALVTEEDESAADGDDGEGGSAADWNQGDFDDLMDSLKCSVNLFDDQMTKAGREVGQTKGKAHLLMAALVVEAVKELVSPSTDKCPRVGKPNGWGDPHLTSVDGVAFDMQSVGEFSLLQAPEIGFDLQGRFAPWGNSREASVMSAIAFTLNGARVEMDGDGGLLVNGSPIDLADGDGLYFNGGAFLSRDGDDYVVFTNRHQSRGVIFMWGGSTLRMLVAPGLATSGVLGSNDGNPSNDLASRDGEAPASVNAGYLHTRFAQSWRIADADSNFTYEPGQSTATHTDNTFPRTAVTLATFPPDEVDDALQTCGGVEEGSAREACALDVLVTGTTDFLDEAMAASSAPVSALPLELDDSGPAQVDFSATVPLNFVPARRMRVDGVGEMAGPFPSGSVYNFDLPVAANHSGIHISMDFVASGQLSLSRTRSLDLAFGRAFTDSIKINRTAATAANGAVTLLAAGSGADGTPWRQYRYTATLPPAAASLGGSVTSIGWSRFQSDRLGLAALRFDLVDPAPAPWREIAIGETVWPDPSADGVNAVLTAPGERERYRFTLEHPKALGLQPVYGRDLQNLCDFSVLVERNTGKRTSPCFYPFDPGNFEPNILPAGDYELRVAAPDDASLPLKFGVQLYEAGAPQTFGATVGDQPVVFEPSDNTGAGIMEAPGADETYDLSIQRTGTLVVQVDCIIPAGDCVSHRGLTLVADPYDIPVDSDRISAFDVTAGNQYRLVLPAMAGRREFKLTLKVVAPGTRQVALGEEVRPGSNGVGVLTEDHPLDRFTFDVPAGGAVTHLDVLPGFMMSDRRSGRLVCTFWRITDSSGNRLDPCMFYGTWLDAGTYELTVRAPWKVELPFQYGFAIYTDDQVTDQQFNLTPDEVDDLSESNALQIEPDVQTGRGYLDNSLSKDTYRFTANGTGTPIVTVRCGDDPTSQPLTTADCVVGTITRAGDWQMGPAAPGSEYEIQINRRGRGHTSFSMNVTLQPPYAYTPGQIIAEGSHGPGTGTLEPDKRFDLYRFQVPVDGEYSLAFEHNSTWGATVKFYEATTGTPAPVWLYPGSTAQLAAGDYLMEVRSGASDYETDVAAADYRLRLREVPARTNIPLTLDDQDATAAEGELLDSSRDVYAITIPAAGQYGLTASAGVHTSISRIAEGDPWPEDVQYLSPARVVLTAGDYLIEVSNRRTRAVDPVPYSFALSLLAPVVSSPYAIGDRIAPQPNSDLGVLTDATDIDRYTFTVPNHANEDEDPRGTDLALTQTGLEDPCSMIWLSRDGEPYDFDCASGFAQYFEPGDYMLDVVPSDSAATPIPYTLSLREPGPSESTSVIVAPEGATKAIDLEGQFSDDAAVHEYELTVNEDDLALGNWLVIEQADGCTDARLLDPDASDAWSEGCQSIIRWAQPGTYRLQTTGAQGEHYSYLAYLTDRVDPALRHNSGGDQ